MSEIPKLVAPTRAGSYDLVLGSRALDRKLIGVRQPWLREQSGRIFNLLMGLTTGLAYRDTQCGFKAFRMDVCRPIVESRTIDRFGFDPNCSISLTQLDCVYSNNRFVGMTSPEAN